MRDNTSIYLREAYKSLEHYQDLFKDVISSDTKGKLFEIQKDLSQQIEAEITRQYKSEGEVHCKNLHMAMEAIRVIIKHHSEDSPPNFSVHVHVHPDYSCTVSKLASAD